MMSRFYELSPLNLTDDIYKSIISKKDNKKSKKEIPSNKKWYFYGGEIGVVNNNFNRKSL